MGLLSGSFNLASTLFGAGGSVTRTLTGGIGGMLSGLLSVLKSGIGGMLSGLLGLFKGTFGAIFTVGKNVFSGLLKLADGALGALGNVARSISGFLGGALKVGISTLAVGVGGLVAGIGKAIQSTTAWGRAVNAFAGSTGLSVRDAGRVQSRYSGLGIDAGQLFGSQNPTAFRMRASVYGLPGYDAPAFGSQLAGKYQGMMRGGMMQQMMAQNMLGSLGLDNEQGRKLANSRPSDLRESERFATRAQSAFGIDAGAISGITRDFDLLIGKFRTLGQVGALALTQKLLPTLNRWADNALGIIERFEGGANGLMTKAVNALLGGIEGAAGGFLTLAKFLAVDAPKAAFGFADSVLSGLQSVVGAVPSMWETFLTGIGWVQAAVSPLFEFLSKGFTGLLDGLPSLFSGVWAGIGNGVNMLQAGIQTLGQTISQTFDIAFIRLGATLVFMGKAYSEDLRLRALSALDGGLSKMAVHRVFGISRSTLDDWLELRQSTGSVAAVPYKRGRRGALDDSARVRAFVEAHPDRTLAEMALAWHQAGGPHLGVMSWCVALKRLGYTRKKRVCCLPSDVNALAGNGSTNFKPSRPTGGFIWTRREPMTP